MTVTEQYENKVDRNELVAALVARDGTKCMFPGCTETLDFSVTEGPKEVTIDHWTPKHYCKANDWSYEEIWDLSNLRLMTKKCNAKKADRVPNEDGTLPDKAVRKFRYRRDKRASRPDLCAACDNGHNLFAGEICGSCGCDAQRFPRWAKVKANECSHDITWCWACSIGIIERESSLVTAMRQAEADEDGEHSTT